jgi:hypothetical protein
MKPSGADHRQAGKKKGRQRLHMPTAREFVSESNMGSWRGSKLHPVAGCEAMAPDRANQLVRKARPIHCPTDYRDRERRLPVSFHLPDGSRIEMILVEQAVR